MSKLDRLEAKRTRRVRDRRRHYLRWKELKAQGRRVRAAYHRVRLRRDKRAIQKLNRLIDAEEQRIASLRIDWNGKDPVGGPRLRAAVRHGLRKSPACYITSTNGGVHSPTSHHYQDEAVDIGAPSTGAKYAFQRAVFDKFGAGYFAELFGPANYPWVKNGVAYTALEHSAIEDQHDNHVHMAVID